MKERKPCMLAIYVLIFYFHRTVRTVRIIEILYLVVNKCTTKLYFSEEKKKKKGTTRILYYFKGKKKKSSFQKYQLSILM